MADSQFYKKASTGTCFQVGDLIEQQLYPGRVCNYDYQCKSRLCDPNLSICDGWAQGTGCSDHEQCSAGLACRFETVWPYATSCQPMADVGTECTSDYDC